MRVNDVIVAALSLILTSLTFTLQAPTGYGVAEAPSISSSGNNVSPQVSLSSGSKRKLGAATFDHTKESIPQKYQKQILSSKSPLPSLEQVNTISLPQLIRNVPNNPSHIDTQHWSKIFSDHPEVASNHFHDHENIPADQMTAQYEAIAFKDVGKLESPDPMYTFKANRLLKNHLRAHGADKEYLDRISLYQRRGRKSRANRTRLERNALTRDRHGAAASPSSSSPLVSISSPSSLPGGKHNRGSRTWERKSEKQSNEGIEKFKNYMLQKNTDPDKLHASEVEVESRRLFPFYNNDKRAAGVAMSDYLKDRKDDQILIDAAAISRIKYNDSQRALRKLKAKKSKSAKDPKKTISSPISASHGMVSSSHHHPTINDPSDIGKFSQEPWWNEAFHD